MTSSDPFVLLGLDAKTATEADIRRAYAQKLKETRPDDDPAGFMALRKAYETARAWARTQMPGDIAEAAADEVFRDDPTLPPDETANSVRLEGLADKIMTLLPKARGGETDNPIKAILNDPGLEGIDAFSELSARVGQALFRVTEDTQISYKVLPPLWMTSHMVKLLDDHFGWSSGPNTHWGGRYFAAHVRYLIFFLSEDERISKLRHDIRVREAKESGFLHQLNSMTQIQRVVLALSLLFVLAMLGIIILLLLGDTDLVFQTAGLA